MGAKRAKEWPAILAAPTANPYGGPGERALALAWQEGYDAGRTDEPCPAGSSRHCEHWREGDGPCCDCGRRTEPTPED